MSQTKKQVTFPEYNTTVSVNTGDNVLQVIKNAGFFINADCGGLNRCGKCIVRVDGVPTRACTCHVMDDIEVVIGQTNEDDYEILMDSTLMCETSGAGTASHELGIAIDIGTTTIAGLLLDLQSGTSIASFAELNGQTPYGTDVISRINCSLDDASELSNLITKQIDKAIKKMLSEANAESSSVKRVVIAGNTAMTYILLNIPCRSLGFSPFKPAYTYERSYEYSQIFHTSTLECECLVFPFISAYIGGDITAGLCALGDEDDYILIDMGTNGELVYKQNGAMICTATAAGPAFEGGCIECGSGSTLGAISKVRLKDNTFEFETIGAAPAASLCGSGLLDIIAALTQKGTIDTKGRFDPPIESRRIDLTDAVFLSQNDVRQFQMAKSAIRSGFDVLVAEMGSRFPTKTYLAGGFGQNLDVESAAVVGLLPNETSKETFAIGNSSLSGTVKVCLDPAAMDRIAEKASQAKEINLATHKLFETLFIENMSF